MSDLTPVVDTFAALFITACAIATTGLLLMRSWLRSRELGEQDDEDD